MRLNGIVSRHNERILEQTEQGLRISANFNIRIKDVHVALGPGHGIFYGDLSDDHSLIYRVRSFVLRFRNVERQ